VMLAEGYPFRIILVVKKYCARKWEELFRASTMVVLPSSDTAKSIPFSGRGRGDFENMVVPILGIEKSTISAP
jgi:hypothetical protein